MVARKALLERFAASALSLASWSCSVYSATLPINSFRDTVNSPISSFVLTGSWSSKLASSVTCSATLVITFKGVVIEFVA